MEADTPARFARLGKRTRLDKTRFGLGMRSMREAQSRLVTKQCQKSHFRIARGFCDWYKVPNS